MATFKSLQAVLQMNKRETLLTEISKGRSKKRVLGLSPKMVPKWDLIIKKTFFYSLPDYLPTKCQEHANYLSNTLTDLERERNKKRMSILHIHIVRGPQTTTGV